MEDNTKNKEKNQKNVDWDKAKNNLNSAKKNVEEFKIDLEKAIQDLGYQNTSLEDFLSMPEPDIDEDHERAKKFLALKEQCKIYIESNNHLDNVIIIGPSNLNEVIELAEKLLVKYSMEKNIYQRSRSIVRVASAVALPEEKKVKKFRSKDAAVIQEVDQSLLTLLLSDIGKFYRLDSDGNASITNCPEKIARYLLAKKEWNLPILTGIINTPTLRKDGSILKTFGYDELSGLLFISDGCDFDNISESPTPEEIAIAKNDLLNIFKDFPFEDEASRSVAIAAVLTALVRGSISSAPMFGFSAPKMSSGKSLLADIVSLFLTGKRNSVISQSQSESEEKKRIISILLEGDPIVCYDNIEKPFGSPTLCSILTEENYKDRILNKNETKSVLTNITFLATGNNLTFAGEISTRALLCKLDPKVERPEERSFDVNLRVYIPQNRYHLVSKCLTLLRGYIAAEKPNQNLKTLGRFEEWSDLIRSAIVWLGLADPCDTRKSIEDSDPIRLNLNSLFYCWHELFKSRGVKAIEIVDKAKSEENEIAKTLKETLIELAINNKGEIDSRILAKKLSLYKNRIEGGYRLLNKGNHQGTTLWAVEKINNE